MTVVRQLKMLLPKDLADRLIIVQDHRGQNIEMYYDSNATFCGLQDRLTEFHVTIDVAFRFADASLTGLSQSGRETFEHAHATTYIRSCKNSRSSDSNRMVIGRSVWAGSSLCLRLEPYMRRSGRLRQH